MSARVMGLSSAWQYSTWCTREWSVLCNWLKLTVSLRAALYNFTGSDSSPNVRCPFHTVLAIRVFSDNSSWAKNRGNYVFSTKNSALQFLCKPMSLEEYGRKRVFSRTPEPPAKVEAGYGNHFFIQRHSARRLHYDLRLEMDGVLKSWALPQGPTLDPNIKRLAVLVEDHPLDYGGFQGTIPSGNYGAGPVILWDRGSYEWLGTKTPAQQWESGDLKFRLHGQKLLGEFALVRTNRSKGKDWLLIKKKDVS